MAQRRPAGAGPARAGRGVPHRRGGLLRQRDDRRAGRLGLDLVLPAHAAGGAAQPVDPVAGPPAARHRRGRVRRHPGRRPGGAAGARAAVGVHPHGVVPAARRLGRRVRGRGAAGRRPDHLDAVLRPRLRLLPLMGAAHGARQLRAPAAPVVRRDGVPARAGDRAGPGGARPRRAAARGGLAGRRVAPAGAGPGVLGQLRGRRLRHRPAPGHRRGHRRAVAARHRRPGRAGLRDTACPS